MLLEACRAGAETVIVSTVPNDNVFKAARRAIREASETINTPRCSFEFKLIPRQGSLSDVLTDLKKKKARFTYVLHDKSQSAAGVAPDLCDAWELHSPGHEGLQSPGHEGLQNIIKQDRDRERTRRAPLRWLEINKRVHLRDYVALKDFVIFDEKLRKEMKRTINQIKLRSRISDGVVCVFLAGPSGSGKTFFLKQYCKLIRYKFEEVPKINLSGVTNIKYALKKHIGDIRSRSAKVAFIDEIDTSSGGYAFRHLMAPMVGEILDKAGRPKPGSEIKKLTWFFAGSAGKTGRELMEELAKHDPKVRDFFGRVVTVIDLPGVSLPFEAMLMGIGALKRQYPALVDIEKKVLLALAITKWRDARHLLQTLEALGFSRKDKKVHLVRRITLKMMRDWTIDPELKDSLSETKKQRLAGYVKLV